MFVKASTVRSGAKSYTYLSLVEAVREGKRTKHRTVVRLGEVSALKASGQLERIVAALRSHLDDDLVAASGIAAETAPALGGIAAVSAYFSALGLDAHFAGRSRRLSFSLPDAVFAMVANRLLDPASKRQVVEWVREDVAAPSGFSHPDLHHYYRALDHLAAAKKDTEAHLYATLTDLTNLDLRLVCYDLTSTYFEGSPRPSDRFPSKAFGYSRDKRGDRPQVVIGLLTTGDGIPVAHHVFSGNTSDVSTLPAVLVDLQERFGVGRITVVADRGLVSADNLAAVSEHGFDHVLATRLHRDARTEAAIAASAGPGATWVPVPGANSAACDLEVEDTRCVVVASAARLARDGHRRRELVARTEAKLLALEDRVREGELKDKAKIAAAATRILKGCGVERLFDLEIGEGRFLYHYDEAAFAYEEALAGRYVLTTSLSREAASTEAVVLTYRRLLEVEERFKVLKDVLRLRPLYHWTEDRVRGHIAFCVYAAVIEALMGADLARAGVMDPDLPDQVLTPRRALRELERVRLVRLDVEGREVEVATRRSPLQSRILAAFGVDAKVFERAVIM